MVETQIPLMVVMAFLGGCFAGAWIGRSNFTGFLLLLLAIVLDIAGWIIYGFAKNWKPAWGVREIAGGILYAAPGMALFVTASALAGFALSVLVFKIVFRKPNVPRVRRGR